MRRDLIVGLVLCSALCACSLDTDRFSFGPDAGRVDAGDAFVQRDGDADAPVDDLGFVDADAPVDDLGFVDAGTDAGSADGGSCVRACTPGVTFAPAFARPLDFRPYVVAVGHVGSAAEVDLVVLGVDSVQLLEASRAPCGALELIDRGTTTTVGSAIDLSLGDIDGDDDDDVAVVSTAGTVALHLGGGSLGPAAVGAFEGTGFGVVVAPSAGSVVVTTGGARPSLVAYVLDSDTMATLIQTVALPFSSGLGRSVPVTLYGGARGFATINLLDARAQFFAYGPTPAMIDAAGVASIPGSANRLAAADLDGDGASDLVTNVIGVARLTILLDSEGAWTDRATVTIGDIADSVALGNFDVDPRPDIVVMREAALRVYPLGSDFTDPGALLGAPRPLSLAGPGADVAVADLDGDGLNDIVSVGEDGTGGYELRVFLGRCP